MTCARYWLGITPLPKPGSRVVYIQLSMPKLGSRVVYIQLSTIPVAYDGKCFVFSSVLSR